MGKLKEILGTLTVLVAKMIDTENIPKLWAEDLRQYFLVESRFDKMLKPMKKDEVIRLNASTKSSTLNWIKKHTGKSLPFSIYGIQVAVGYGTTGNVFYGGSFVRAGESGLFIKLNVHPKVTYKQCIENIKEAEEILAHELTHLMQYAYKVEEGDSSSQVSHGATYEAYYNSPREVRAFARTIYEQIKDLLATRIDLQTILEHNKIYKNIIQYMEPANKNLLNKLIYLEVKNKGNLQSKD